jgi:lysophospholipase L1-like esterase/beta-glucanase (GH16 family)
MWPTMKTLIFVVVELVLALHFTTVSHASENANGPIHYPDASNEAAWPGVGPIRDFHWIKDNRNFFWSRRDADKGAVVFIGDSLTGNWKTMKEDFAGYKVANRGIGGDVSRGVLFRLQEDVLDLEPRAIVLLIGGNDLSAHARPEDLAGNIDAMLKLIEKHDPKLPVLLCKIPPRDSPTAPTRPGDHQKVNERIEKLAAKYDQVELLELFKEFGNQDGSPDLPYFADDRLHLGPKAYEKWRDLTMPFVKAHALVDEAAKLLDQITWVDPATAKLASIACTESEVIIAEPTTARVPDGFQLAFSDEFNGKTVDKSKWFHRFIYDNAKLDFLNNETGRRVDSALSIVDGALTITATPRNDGKWNTGLCRSRWTFKYGYIEGAVKFPDNRGAWPSFWLNSGIQYPDGTFSRLTWPPEIDIFELVNNGREGPYAITSFVHGKKAIGETTYSILDKNGNYIPGYSFADGKWHVIGCHWTPTESTTYVDGVMIVSRKYRWVYDDGEEAVPAHILCDLAVGGKWPGEPTNDDPMTLQFDYVRVYQDAGH